MANEKRSGHGSLTIETDQDRVAWRIVARGELDLNTARTLDAELRAAEASDSAQIILDLSALEFIDSTGLRTVVEASRRVGRDRLGVVRGSGHVARLMEVTVLDEIVRFID